MLIIFSSIFSPLLAAINKCVRIPISLTTEFKTKARGTIRGDARVDLEEVSKNLNGEFDKDLVTYMYDKEGTCVATVSVKWRFSLKGSNKESSKSK